MHVSDDGCIIDELNIARLKPRLHRIVTDHLHVQVVPQLGHYFEKLQHQVVLAQIVPGLEQKLFDFGFPIFLEFVFLCALVLGVTVQVNNFKFDRLIYWLKQRWSIRSLVLCVNFMVAGGLYHLRLTLDCWLDQRLIVRPR